MAELVEEPLPKGVKRIGPVNKAAPAATTEEEPLPKGVRRIGPVDPNKEPVQSQKPPPGVRLGAPDFEKNKEYNRLNDVRQKLRLERQKELGIELKAFAKTRQDELAASPPPPEWKKTTIMNERGEEVEVMKRSTASMQHDLAMKTYRKIAEMEPGEVQDFLDGFHSSGKKGVDLEGTLRLLPFVGAFLDYNETALLNQAAMDGKPTPSAQALLTAKNTQLQMQSLVNHGRWGDVGALMNQMVPFALEFMVTRGVGGEASSSLRGLAATTVKTAPKTAAVLKATAAATKSGLGSAVTQTAVNVPRIAATAEARKTPELGGITRNEAGELVSAPVTEEARLKAEGTLEATLKSFGSGVVENFTERFGGFADDLFMAVKARGLNLSKKALEKTLSNVGENGMTALQKKAREVGIDSFLGEVLLEEVPSQIGTALVTGDELNLDYDQLLNLGIAAGIPGGVVTAAAVPRAIGYLFNKIPKKPVDKSGKPITQTDKYEVTGEILIQKASTGKHTDVSGVDVTEYTTGLVHKRTGKPIIVHEINDGQSVMFQTPEGEFVGTSVQDVANQVQRAGLPQVTEGQVAQAEKIIGATGYNKESFKLALIDVFNYPKRQADIIATIADRMVQTIAKREGITPDQAYQKIKLAKGEITEKGEIVEVKKEAAPSKADKELADKLKMPVSKLVEAETDAKTGKYTNAPLQDKGGEAKGAYVPQGGGKGLIFAFAGADITTALHELSHHYELTGVMTAAEKTAIERWSGAKAGSVEFSEAFARGFETFLKDGKVSSPEMKDAFSKFKKYLSDAIKAWIDTGRPLSKPMENIYRDMLGEPAVEALKTKADAVQKQKTNEVSVQPAPGDGKAVGKGNVEPEKAPTKGKEEETSKVVKPKNFTNFLESIGLTYEQYGALPEVEKEKIKAQWMGDGKPTAPAKAEKKKEPAKKTEKKAAPAKAEKKPAPAKEEKKEEPAKKPEKKAEPKKIGDWTPTNVEFKSGKVVTIYENKKYPSVEVIEEDGVFKIAMFPPIYTKFKSAEEAIAKVEEVFAEKEEAQTLGKRVRNAKSVREGLEHIAASKNRFAELAKWLLKHGDKKGLDVPVKINKRQSRGVYRGGQDAIELPEDAGVSLFIHEAIHGFTAIKLNSLGAVSYSMRDDKALFKLLEKPGLDKNVANLIKAYREAKKVIKAQGGHKPYGITNLNEFLAEGLSNPVFQKQLDTIPFPGSTKSVWQTVVDAVKGILGFSPAEGRMLDAFLRDAAELTALSREEAATGKKAAPPKAEKKEEKKAKAPKEVAAVHKAAKEAGVDINSKDFADISEELTGERHLDNMTPEQLQLVEAYITEEMNEANRDVPDMEEVDEAEEIDETEEEAPAPAKAKATAKAKPTGDQFEGLPAVQRGAVKKKIGEKFKLVGVKKFGDKILPVVEMKRPDGGPAFVTHKGDVFYDLDNAVKKSLAEEKKSKKKAAKAKVANTSVTQPAMQPAKAEVADKHIEKVKAEPKKEVPKTPKRTVTQQPSEDVESTSVVVVEALKGLDFMPDTVADLTDLVASMDEEGRPLGPAKAFAIIHQMQTEGFIEIDGKRVTPLFQLSPSQQQGSKDYITNAQKQVLADIAKATAHYNPAANMNAASVASLKDLIDKVGAGTKGDLGAIAEAISEAYDISAADAKAIAVGLKNAVMPVVDLGSGSFWMKWFDDFGRAITSGRGHILSQYGAAGKHFLSQVSSIKPSDFLSLPNYFRVVGLLISAPISVVQAAKTLAIGNLESEFIAPRMRSLGNWFASKMAAGVVHRDIFIRNISQFMNGFYRGLTYSTAGIEAQARLRGGQNEAHVLAQRLMEEMYTLVGRDGVKLSRVHAVLDPEVYEGTTYAGITESALGTDELLLLQVLRDNMALLHDHSFARGYISEETYLKHKEAGGYFGREYEEIINSQTFGNDVDAAFGAVRGDFSLYTKRKDFKDIDLTIEKDPVFIAAKRMSTAVTNQAVTDYGDYIADSAASKVITYSEADFEKMKKGGHPMKGFTHLRGSTRTEGIYGALTNRYVPNYIAYDFKGFFLTNRLAQYSYNAVKQYDRLWIRQFVKKLHTVYNPAVFLGNQASNYTFAFANDVDLFNFNIMLSEAKKTIEDKDAIYHTLLEAGVIGTDIVGSELAPLRKKEEAQAKVQNKPSLARDLSAVSDKVIKAYSESDDRAKIAAYRVKTEVQGKSKEQAITEVLSGFQNYQSVGMYFDIGSKLPIWGNPFVKFLGDVQRIAASSVAYRPLTTAAYLGSIYALQALASDMSGEDEERKEVREGRPFQPRIPFTDIPLTFKLGGMEVNLARYVFPFTLYDRGEATEGMWNTIGELMPVQPYVFNGPTKPGYWKFSDPILGTIVSVCTDTDFRGMSIANPTKTADPHEQRMNQGEYLVRSFGFIPTTATDLYRIIMNGQDYYGRNRTEMQRLMSIFIRVEEFGDPEVRKVLTNRIIDLNYNVERIHDKANALYRAGEKNLIKIQGNSTLTDEQRERQIMAEYDRTQKSILGLAEEYVEANKKLTEVAEYTIKIGEHLSKTAEPIVSQP